MEEAGLSQDLLTQLLLKVMHFGADYTGIELARRVGLQFAVIDADDSHTKFAYVFEQMRSSQA